MTCSPPVPVPELQGEPDDIVQEKCLLAVEKVSDHYGVAIATKILISSL